MTFTESVIEQASIAWLQELDYRYAFGPEIALDLTLHIPIASRIRRR
jgi:hypothetical protein